MALVSVVLNVHAARRRGAPARDDKKEQKFEEGSTLLAAEETMLMHVTQSVEEKQQ